MSWDEIQAITDIPIHAPVKGATGSGNARPLEIDISIHAPVKGATFAAHPDPGVLAYFNPRSREGSDRGLPTRRPERPNFNPRSREGSDDWIALGEALQKISIHAPVKGATYLSMVQSATSHISIHAPVKGATSKTVR